MTICAGMLCFDGIVLCADTLESVGSVHRSVEKLVELKISSDAMKAVVVCATDDGIFSDALIERISESLNRSNGTYASARKAIESATLEYCKEIWEAYDAPQIKPTAAMLIGLKTADDLRLLHLSTPTVRAIETWEFIGYGAELGIYKAGQYGLKDMPTDTAAPIIAYIVDIVKNNVPFCGRSTSLAVLHADGNVEHKSQDYISKTTQGYKSIGWLLDTWVFPFLPLFVGEAGEDALSMIGKLGEPKADWVEKIPEMLKFLAARKKSILAGETPAIPENQKRKVAVSGLSLAARMIVNSAKQLHEENLLSEESNRSISARYTKINELSQLVSTAVNNSEIDLETIKQSIDRLCLLLTSFESLEQLMLETSEDQPPPYAEESPEKES
jgi:hypothetical protein